MNISFNPNKPYSINTNEKGFVPVSSLDGVMSNKSGTSVTLYDFSGHPIIDMKEFIKKYKQQVEDEIYETVDHLPYVIKFGDINIICISLDTSTRAINNGYPLFKRMDKITEMINNILSTTDKSIVCFSEAGRPAYDKDLHGKLCDSYHMIEQDNIVVPWIVSANKISCETNLNYITCYRHNHDDKNDTLSMAFGHGIFATKNIDFEINTERILLTSKSRGSIMTRILTPHGNIGFVHFPIEFRLKGKDNPIYECMMKSSKMLMENQIDLLCGDMNKITGNPRESFQLAVEDSGITNDDLLGDKITFVGAYYDRAPTNENPLMII